MNPLGLRLLGFSLGVSLKVTSVNKYHNSLVKGSSSEGSSFVSGEWSFSSYAKKT